MQLEGSVYPLSVWVHPSSVQVLVKVEAASINPSDVLFVSGKYDQEPGKDKEIPAYVGFEGMLNAAI